MPNPHSGPARPRDDLLLTRTLAAILLPFGPIMRLAGLIGASSVAQHRSWKEFGVTAAAMIAGWTLTWLSWSLWTGRGVPAWFIRAFFISLFALPMVAVLTTGTWDQVKEVSVMVMPMAVAAIFCVAMASQPRASAGDRP